jgi:hypothetical protein
VFYSTPAATCSFPDKFEPADGALGFAEHPHTMDWNQR